MGTPAHSKLFPEEDFPLHHMVVNINGISVPEDQFNLAQDNNHPDIVFLKSLDLPQYVAFGAADMPIHLFITEVSNDNPLNTFQNVLDSLRPKHFASEHIKDLNVTQGPHPGYHPGTMNDEIHTDFGNQIFFRTATDIIDEWADQWREQNGGEDPPDPPREISNVDYSTRGAHGKLKAYVANNRIWYVNLHTTKTVDGFSDMVIIFAIGVSPSDPHRLVGLISSQVCHNLCD